MSDGVPLAFDVGPSWAVRMSERRSEILRRRAELDAELAEIDQYLGLSTNSKVRYGERKRIVERELADGREHRLVDLARSSGYTGGGLVNLLKRMGAVKTRPGIWKTPTVTP